MSSKLIKLLTVIITTAFCTLPAYSQYLYTKLPHASNIDWTFNHRLQIMDKSHAFGDSFYDRGFTRVYTRRGHREYELDMMNQEFSFGDQYAWHKNGLGFRSRFASYKKATWAVYSELHSESKLTSRSRIGLHTYLQQHARANRALFEFEYKLNIGKKNSISLSNTISEYKKDMDFTVSYRRDLGPVGNVRLDYTFQDYYNNLVNTAGNNLPPTGEENRKIEKEITTPSFFILGRWTAPKDKWYNWDLSFIYQPKIKYDVTDRIDEQFFFEETKNLYLINGLLSVRYSSFVGGVYGYMDYTATKRISKGVPFKGMYMAKQRSLKGGVFLYGKIWRFEPKLRISFENYYDRQYGDDFSISVIERAFDYQEPRRLIDIGLGYRISEKIHITARYMQLNRYNQDKESVRFVVKHLPEIYMGNIFKDNRIAFHITTKFHPKVRFEVFGAYDIDGDDHEYNPRVARFDKGGGKLIVLF